MKLWLACALMLLAVLPAFADTYTYTGNDFTQVYGTEGYTTSDDVHGYFDSPTPLMAGQTYDFYFLPTFSFTDGVQTIDQSNAKADFFFLATDSHDVISNWLFIVDSGAGFIDSCAGTGPAANCVDGSADFVYRYATQSGGNVPNNPGHWRAGTVPEPNSFLLLGIGTLLLLGKAFCPNLPNRHLPI